MDHKNVERGLRFHNSYAVAGDCRAMSKTPFQRPPRPRRSISGGAFIGGALLLGAGIAYSQPFAALIVPIALCIAALTLLVVRLFHRSEGGLDSERILRWTLACFALRLAFGLAVTNSSFGLGLFGGDDATYHQGALAILSHWQSGAPGPELPAGKEGFYFTLAGLYAVFGPHTSSGLVLNAALGAALVPLLTNVTARLFGEGAARYVAPLVMFNPGLFFWSSLLLKEAAVLFLIVSAVSCAAGLSDRGSPAYVVGIAGALTPLFAFRAPVALVLAAGLIGGIILVARPGKLAALAMTTALLGVLIFGLGVGASGLRSAASLNLEHANVVRQDLSTSAESGFDTHVDISTPLGAALYLPQGLLAFLLGPFPWELQGFRQLLVLPDVLLWWVLLPMLWYGLREGWKRVRRRIFVLILPALSTSILLSLVVGNFGTLVRERMQVVVLAVPFIALGLSIRHQRAAGSTGQAVDRAVRPSHALSGLHR